MATPYIIDAVRTPMARGRPNGAFAIVHPVDLLAGVLTSLVDRTGIDPGQIDDVLTGCVSQVGEQYNNVGRMAHRNQIASPVPVLQKIVLYITISDA